MTNSFPVAEEVDETSASKTTEDSSPPVTTQSVRKEQGSGWARLGWPGRGTGTPWLLLAGSLAMARQPLPNPATPPQAAPRSQAAPPGKREEATTPYPPYIGIQHQLGRFALPKLPTTLSTALLLAAPAWLDWPYCLSSYFTW